VANTLAQAITSVNDNGGQAQAAASAVANALTSGGAQSQAFVSAIAQAYAQGGCGAVSNVLARE
jgi:hypothetical protein